MEMTKEAAEKLGLIISNFRNVSRIKRKPLLPMLEETLEKELAATIYFYIKGAEASDVETAVERSMDEDGLNPFFAACNIMHLDQIGDSDLFAGIVKIFMTSVREKKLVALLMELYELRHISALSLNARASIVSWLFSSKEYISDEVMEICTSPFFFPSDAYDMVSHLIRFEMYDEALAFSIENQSANLRMLLARKLPLEYLAHLLDSPQDVIETIDKRFQTETLD